jgi:hypothetical protein
VACGLNGVFPDARVTKMMLAQQAARVEVVEIGQISTGLALVLNSITNVPNQPETQ